MVMDQKLYAVVPCVFASRRQGELMGQHPRRCRVIQQPGRTAADNEGWRAEEVDTVFGRRANERAGRQACQTAKGNPKENDAVSATRGLAARPANEVPAVADQKK